MTRTDWRHDLIVQLAARIPAGYEAGGEPASEPTALVGLALVVHNRMDAARLSARWLADQQARDGSIGIAASRPTPCWTTSLAALLWQSIDATDGTGQFRGPLDRAVEWAIADRGQAAPRKPHVGHDTTLVGWSWAANTHSWLEPTALFVLALKAAGRARHPRTREAVRLIIDRLLPSGGCNYGNTTVLGQELLPHVEPTGVAMMALAGEAHNDPRIERSLVYLQRELAAETATASLCYGLLGLAAHGRAVTRRDDWLEHAHGRVLQQGGSPCKLALIALASAAEYPLRAAQ
jgi:hypothetical protein